ncbi:MAG: DMT family transporter [Burkholderiales bacterium]|nr:MAG: DMT family transporter [Burkholderiales bacterium]
MKPADFGLLFVVCLVWALNLVITRWTVTVADVPPIFFAGVRLGLVGLLLAPFLFPAPRQIGLMFLIGMGMGSVQFGLLFLGLANASASAAAVIGQLGVPITTIFSMMFLGEQIGWRRALGIIMSFVGVMIIAIDPEKFTLTLGMILLVLAAVSSSGASVLMKRIEPMSAMKLQAWVGTFSVVPLMAMSFVTETGQAEAVFSGDPLIYLSTAFAVLAVSIFGHGTFYRMIKKYDVTLISPLTLMTPIWGVVLGISLLGEPLTAKLVIGAVVALAGVGVIMMRPNRRFPEAPVGDKIGP